MQIIIDFFNSGIPIYVIGSLAAAVVCALIYTNVDKTTNPLLKIVFLVFSVLFAGGVIVTLLVGFQFIGTLPHTLGRYLASQEDRSAALATCPDMFSYCQVVENSDCKLAKKAQAKIDNDALFEPLKPLKNDSP